MWNRSAALTSWRCLALVTAIALCAPAAGVEPVEADRLKLAALIQEGDLLLEEVARLEPAGQELTREGAALDETERTLRSESTALDADIRTHNTALAELDQAVKAHLARCPKESTDKALVESCNARVVELQATGKRLNEETAQLAVRQRDLNRRAQELNEDRQDWNRRRQDQEKRVAPNRSDVEYWVERADAFLGSTGFAGLAQSAGDPPACAREQVGGLRQLHFWEALKRGQACFKAVKAAGG